MTTATDRKTVGLYGGSFNPPHVAHVCAVGWALSVGAVEGVWVIPTGGHPFGKPLSPFADRLAMCALAFECFGDRVRTLDLEREPRVHYSVDTIKRIAHEHPGASLRWIIGSDSMSEREQWRDFETLERMAPPLVIGREGFAAGSPSFSLPDISSTSIRDLLTRRPETDDQLAAIVPAGVLQYITERGLFARAS